jgi:diadenosine tetraphosphate (Ap4A) HIT family hydrolase
MPESTCLFCAIVSGNGPPHETVAETPRALAFMNANPAGFGHMLVIPKAHAIDIWDLQVDDGSAVWQLVRQVATAARSALHPDGLNPSWHFGSSWNGHQQQPKVWQPVEVTPSTCAKSRSDKSSTMHNKWGRRVKRQQEKHRYNFEALARQIVENRKEMSPHPALKSASASVLLHRSRGRRRAP